MAIIRAKRKWPPRVGVTVGKFKPMHLGHELMIHMAAAEFDELIVIVSDDADIHRHGVEFTVVNENWYVNQPLNFRYKMIVEKMRKYTNVRVVKHLDTYGPPAAEDQHGTGVDEDFWKYWTNVFQLLAPDANYFVSSDRYGREAARRMSTHLHQVKWFPVDPGRELIEVSATKIRNDPVKYWRYISQEFRHKFGKRVLVIGPESTGKTTLTKDLARAWASPAVPEYGRILSEAKDNELDEEDFMDIAKRHHELELFAIRNSETGLVISDTDILTTYLFSKVYLDQPMEEIKQMHTPNWYDLVVILPPLIPWDDDGTRVIPSLAERKEFFADLVRGYKTNKNVLVLTETDRKRRVEQVSLEIFKLLGQEKDYSDTYDGLTKQDTSLIMNE